MRNTFTEHAKRKFAVLRRHGIHIEREAVIDAVEHPESIDHSRSPLRIAQTTLDTAHVLRVVYRIVKHHRIIITFYPGRLHQYGK